MARASATARVKVSEYDMHCAVADYCRAKKHGRDRFIHIPNEGKRSFAVAAMLKRMGMRKGVADFFFPSPRAAYHGMWLELKAPGKKPTYEQVDFLTEMLANGYYCTWVDSYEQAIYHIERYFSLPAFTPRFHVEHPDPDTTTQALQRAE